MSACRICACTDEDCSWCIVLTNEPCSWVESDLCSACESGGNPSIGEGVLKDDVERARCRGRRALLLARRRSGRAPGFMQLAEHGENCIRVCVRLEIAQRKTS